MCYGQQHDFQNAIAVSNKVLESNPANDEALLLRGLAYADLGKRQEAVSDLR